MDMAVTPETTLDARALRRDFPVFEEEIHGKPLAYLDTASSSQKPRQVLDLMRETYEHGYANVHRGVYELAERSTEAYEGARLKVQRLLNAPSAREVVFTRNVTHAMNLVAYAWGLANLGPGDVAVVSELDHHAVYVPWQYIAGRTGATLRVIPVDANGELQLDALDEIASAGRVRVVATNHISNTLGTVNPVERLAEWAHERDAIMIVDAAQSAPHRTLDVQALGCDFLGFTSHKMCGPGGAGVLWGREELLAAMEPFETGGEMIRSVRFEGTTWNDLPYKFEAGTPAIVEAVGLGGAIDYLEGIGFDAIQAHEHEVTAYALERLSELPWVKVYGPPLPRRAGIISFNVEGVHPHDVSQILDRHGVAIRAGHHCTQPLMQRLGVAATNRASFYLYTIPEEIDQLVEGLHAVRKVFA